jgi:flagellar biosynthesis chaperone FliJ
MLEKGDGFMATYMDAVEEFRESATAFIQNLNLLAQAREAYQQAMTASAELRSVLDAGDQNLRTLMTQLEQALDLHTTRAVLDSKKKPEPVKSEPPKPNGESAGGVRAFP